MKLLILGGTKFVGRHLVEAALAAGYEVTLFNRGLTNPALFPQVEKLKGDRDCGLQALEGRQWDAAIDTSGYVPRIVRASAELLAQAVEHYTFISSVSVYGDLSVVGMKEDAPVGKLADESVEEIGGGAYGPLKALCEQALQATMPGRALVVRPGLIAGPHDPTDRFTYWPWRVAQGGEVLAPGKREARVQLIDGRDLAAWVVRMVSAGQTGTYNAVGPEEALSMADLLETCKTSSGSEAGFSWIGADFLLAQGVEPWMGLPLWLPGTEHAGMLAVDNGKALGAGLTLRPLAETAADTLAWARTRPDDHTWQAGLSRERETELLEGWRKRLEGR